MKCKYCGSNLAIEDEVCPYCGKENPEAAGHRATMRSVRAEYEQTREETKIKSRSAGRIGRMIVIGLMLLTIFILWGSVRRNSDIDYREEKKRTDIARTVEENRENVTATLRELEANREYLALDSYVLTYRLRGDDTYLDYSRVFTAVINYRAIFEDILQILSGYEGYSGEGRKEWCEDAAIYISSWRQYVDGDFWYDASNSPMHGGEHGAFLKDIKNDTRDMVQVYFGLTDEEASSMWDMDEEALGEMLYERCRRLYPEEGDR